MTDMFIDNGYFYVLFQELVRPHLFLARARIDTLFSTTSSGYIQNGSEGWSIAAEPLVNGQYTWKPVTLGQQIDFDNLDGLGTKAYPVMPSINAPQGGPVKQGSIARIFKSGSSGLISKIFGVTSDAGGVVQLWSTNDSFDSFCL